MKKLLSFTLVLALCFGLAIPALSAGNPGDSTITDEKGNIYTLSNQILYTISQEQLKQIPLAEDYYTDEIMAGRDFPLENITQAYAIPSGTTVTAPSGIDFEGFIWVDTAEKDGVYYALDSGMGTPIWNAIRLDDEDGNTFWILPCYRGDGSVFVSYIAFFTPSEENRERNPFASAAPEPPSFSDVAAEDYFAEPVAWAVEKKITNGTSATKFSPNITCTTAQILTFLWRAKGAPEPAGQGNDFTDVQEGDYYYKAALWALENGLVSGTAFHGDAPCTRAATVTYLWKLAGSPAASTGTFSDVAGDADYAQAVAWAVQQEITNGTSQTMFSPAATCTRGQIVTFLYRAYR